jgi:iron complex transport system ATP-binding protein
MNNYLEIKNLTCGYSNAFQLKDVSFSITRGMFAGIIGPNGSGKTTLFRSITGELEVRSGSILLNTANLVTMPLKEKATRLAVVTQFTESLDISVEEYVIMGRIPYRGRFQFFENTEDIRIAEKYMELTDVIHLRNHYMSQLSAGEQQLAAIARALAQEPDLLLLDEPTAHLDISHQVQILNLLQSLSTAPDLTVLMIIHDLNLAGEYCDYLVMLNKGRLHKKGTPNEVLNYSDIEEVYKTVVITQTNPLSKRPAVFLVSNKVLTKDRTNKN